MGKSRLTVVSVEKDLLVMIITMALLIQKECHSGSVNLPLSTLVFARLCFFTLDMRIYFTFVLVACCLFLLKLRERFNTITSDKLD